MRLWASSGLIYTCRLIYCTCLVKSSVGATYCVTVFSISASKKPCTGRVRSWCLATLTHVSVSGPQEILSQMLTVAGQVVQLWTLPISKTLAHASSFRCFKAGDKMDISHFDYGSSKSGHPYGDPDTWQAGFSLLDAEKSEGLISFFNIETSLLFVRFSKCQQTFLLKKLKILDTHITI